MDIRIKQKLVAGVIFQFLLFLLVGGVFIFLLIPLKNESMQMMSYDYINLSDCE